MDLMKLLKQTIDVPGSEPEQKPRTEEVDNPYEDPNKQVNVNITIEGGDDTLNIPPENNKEETAPTKPDEDYEVAYTEGSNDADEVMMEAFRAIENAKSIVRIMNADNFVATESIYSAARNAVFGLVNIVGHLTSLFTNTLFNGWRDFKRSELNFYVHSNIATVNALYKLRYIEVEDVDVPVPQGMKGRYNTAVIGLISYFDTVNMLKLVKAMKSVSKSVVTAIKENGTLKFEDNNVNFKKLKDIKKSFESLSTSFANDAGDDFNNRKFKDVFTDSHEMGKVIDNVIDCDKFFREVSSVYDNVEDVENNFREVANIASSLTSKQLDALADVARMYAETITDYATAINDLNRVQHNLVMVIKYLRSALNY